MSLGSTHYNTYFTCRLNYSQAFESGISIAIPKLYLLFLMSRRMSGVQEGVTVSVSSVGQLWSEASTTCLTLVLHLNTNNVNTTTLALNLLEEAGLRKFPEAVVVVLGPRRESEGGGAAGGGGGGGGETVLLHHTFRNTLHAFYLALTTDLLSEVAVREEERVILAEMWLYSVIYIDQFRDLGGHRFQVVAIRNFPYTDFIVHGEQPGSEVEFTHSIDDELFTLLSAKLNFTWKVNEQMNRAFGLGNAGVFSGMVGDLQREEFDIGTPPTITAGRAKAMDFARGYPSVPLVLASLKPSLLPQHFALVRPFKDEVWGSLLAVTVVWAVVAWVIQQVWTRLTDEGGYKLSTFMMYGWAALLEQSITNPFTRNSYQMVVGGWILFCLIVSSCYKGSLISHLSVQGKTKPIETMEELVSIEEGTWNWGIEKALFQGPVIELFRKPSNPVVKKFAEKFKVVRWQDGMEMVRGGRYAFLGFQNILAVLIASYFTDDRGRSPFFLSKKGIPVLNDLGWGLRKGMPVTSKFSQMFQHLDESGLMNLWTDNKVKYRVNNNRKQQQQQQQQQSTHQGTQFKDDDESNLVLGMEHLQGAFYFLLFGVMLAILSLLAENITHYLP
ncbi:hypothetical protein Pmani_033066 [Petrolisthes manimaculis]|uniref:Ionotropic glutamate receptor C-terminal domain-containing protein n=1 Tax=Petrolisthes manimaculis TaxID=1843537 RepID=A0AAE1TQF4_9EUCA|nr:hypothetical protein Pmani_033066 [Petrolisthes manimaculis]